MPRITVDISDAILSQIDAEVGQQKVSRSKWAANAIESYLHQKCITSDADMHQLEKKVMQLQEQLDAKTREIDTLNQKEEHVQTDAGVMQEVHQLKDQLEAKEMELTVLKTEDEKKWRETSQLRSETSQAKRELESTRAKIDQLQIELEKKRIETEQARSEADALKLAQAHFQETINLRDQHISFLESTVHQALEKLPRALPPSEEEAKKKGWWQFWR